MTTRRRRDERDSGAALILAIGFVLSIGAIGGGLASLATTSLTGRRSLEVARDREYAADTAIENAITQVRGMPVATCTATSGSVAPVAPSVTRVDWSTVCTAVSTSAPVVSYPQRNMIFSACISANPCTPADVIIRAQVNFEPATGPVIKTFVQSWNVNK